MTHRFQSLFKSGVCLRGKGLVRAFSDQPVVVWKSAPLSAVAVIRMKGADSAAFLQGLMTNDMAELEEPACSSIYGMFLNTGGRVMFDTIVCRGWAPGEFLLQVDRQLASMVVKHLSLYKVRRKVVIEAAADLHVSAIFSDSLAHKQEAAYQTRAPLIGSTYCDGGNGGTVREVRVVAPLSLPEDPPGRLCLPDPRLDLLGSRMVGAGGDIPSASLAVPVEPVKESEYHARRYRLGVAEGGQEIPAGKALPLEYNLDYLRGVNFHKGCYLGQELTARTHHTGVIRKRVLPIETVDSTSQLPAQPGAEIRNQQNKAVGRLLTAQGGHGLAMVRLQEGFSADSLTCLDQPVRIQKPVWWPPEKKPAKAEY